ncbi:MAG: hypothetical protein KAW49_02065, partial [Anaerolineae bacterium]|nr:hypothetical protein [Anaerolineae bacterium]
SGLVGFCSVKVSMFINSDYSSYDTASPTKNPAHLHLTDVRAMPGPEIAPDVGRMLDRIVLSLLTS